MANSGHSIGARSMSNLLDGLRAKLVAFAQSATMADLERLPEDIFFSPTKKMAVVVESADAGNGEKRKRLRLRKHTQRHMTREDADSVRAALAEFDKDSEAYLKARDKIAREMGFSRRQIAAAANGLERAKRRKRSKK